jgi:3-deoxy-D-manno-octulosonic acid kinase
MNSGISRYQFTPLLRQPHGGLEFFSRFTLSPESVEQISDAIRRSSVEKAAPLEGRGVSLIVRTSQFGGVFIKQYRRGGVLRFVVPDLYLGLTPRRVLHEFEMLERALASGVAVPRPLCVVSSGKGLYRGWLVIEEFPQAVSMASKAVVDEASVRKLCDGVVEQIHNLIHAKIFHRDLHPGNVLVNSDNRVVIIDFDKASYFAGSKNDLRDRYLTRWRRAVIKHRLPEILSEGVCPGLRLFMESKDGMPQGRRYVPSGEQMPAVNDADVRRRGPDDAAP